MDPAKLFERYEELQQYVGWTADDARMVHSLSGLMEPHLLPLIDDFYAEIERHPDARKVITGGSAQIERLKGTLVQWLRELFAGCYDQDYVVRRWRVGCRHVEIGLDQVFTNVALSRLRGRLIGACGKHWQGNRDGLVAAIQSLNKLLDLDLAKIEDAYQTEYRARLQRSERLAAIGQAAAAFRTLVEAAPSMIVILRLDYTLTYLNPFTEQLTGYKANEVIGKDYFGTFLRDADLRELFFQEPKDIVAGPSLHGVEFPVVCKNGARRWIVWNAQTLNDYEGGPAIIAIGQDITSLKLAQEQALQAERLAAIGQMMTGLAHESGNALARSQACLEMLAFESEDRPKSLNLISRIQAAQDHLRQLYDEVRNYAAPIKLELEPWNLSHIWRQAWDNLHLIRQGRTAALVEDTDGLDLRCFVDQFRLGQVFRNILENALAACQEPVEIKVFCTRAEIAGQPAIRIAFRDNGPGLNSEQRQRIFDPFFTTKTKGTGLGMAIAKRIVEAHGGQIAVGSCPGRGAEILVTLPHKKP